jgi:hypothetical protein
MKDEIILLKNNDNRTDSDLEKVQELYRFLTGEEIPKAIHFIRGNVPKMSKNKAFSIIYYLQEHLPLLPDHIEKCSVCGDLFDDQETGIYWESKGKHYCGSCDYLVPDNYDRGLR